MTRPKNSSRNRQKNFKKIKKINHVTTEISSSSNQICKDTITIHNDIQKVQFEQIKINLDSKNSEENKKTNNKIESNKILKVENNVRRFENFFKKL